MEKIKTKDKEMLIPNLGDYTKSITGIGTYEKMGVPTTINVSTPIFNEEELNIPRDYYAISSTPEGELMIGCQAHTIYKWENMERKQLLRMDGQRAVEWYGDHMFDVIEEAEEGAFSIPPFVICWGIIPQKPKNTKPEKNKYRKNRKSGMLSRRTLKRQGFFAPIFHQFTEKQQAIILFLCDAGKYPYGRTQEDWDIVVRTKGVKW